MTIKSTGDIWIFDFFLTTAKITTPEEHCINFFNFEFQTKILST